MQDWSRYYLKDIPFVESTHIQVESNDDKLNGRIFSKLGMEKPYKTVFDLVNRQRRIIYVRSDDKVRGTGKSALAAAVYWETFDSRELGKDLLPVWVSVHDFRTINQLMGRIVETLVYARVIEAIQNKLKEVNYATIDQLLAQKKRQRLSGEIGALTLILSQSREKLAWKYVNIRRTYPTIGHFELFTDLLMMFGSVDARKVLVFIDQFEEYVEYQTGGRRVQLANDVKDLYRSMAEAGNLSFIVTMHPVTQNKFENVGQEIISTYGEIMENSATVEPLKPRHLVEMARTYIEHYRADDSPKTIYNTYPIKDDVLEYVANHCDFHPRTMINILSKLLNEAIATDPPTREITMRFVKTPVVYRRIGLAAA